jgi:CRISPR-associated protein Cas6
MFWQEQTRPEDFQVPDDVIDLVFDIQCRELPVDHAYALSRAVTGAAPWIGESKGVAVHTVHVAGSQNGWERPEHGSGSRILLSRRTRLTIRVPAALKERLVADLSGRTLDVEGCPLKVEGAREKSLAKQTTLFARYVVSETGEPEDAFLQRAAAELAAEGIHMRKALCGKLIPLETPDGPLWTRSLMLADLTLEEAVRLQQKGLGDHRHMGCGIFIPHKGIDAVHKTKDD